MLLFSLFVSLFFFPCHPHTLANPALSSILCSLPSSSTFLSLTPGFVTGANGLSSAAVPATAAVAVGSPPADTAKSTDDDDLSDGAIVGIAFGCVLGVVLLVLLVVYHRRNAESGMYNVRKSRLVGESGAAVAAPATPARAVDKTLINNTTALIALVDHRGEAAADLSYRKGDYLEYMRDSQDGNFIIARDRFGRMGLVACATVALACDRPPGSALTHHAHPGTPRQKFSHTIDIDTARRRGIASALGTGVARSTLQAGPVPRFQLDDCADGPSESVVDIEPAATQGVEVPVEAGKGEVATAVVVEVEMDEGEGAPAAVETGASSGTPPTTPIRPANMLEGTHSSNGLTVTLSWPGEDATDVLVACSADDWQERVRLARQYVGGFPSPRKRGEDGDIVFCTFYVSESSH